jgi:hypothetical protein
MVFEHVEGFEMSKSEKRILLALSASAGVLALVSTQAQVEDVSSSRAANADCDATLEVASGESVLDRVPDLARGASGLWDPEGENTKTLVVYHVRIDFSDVVLTAVRASASPSDSNVFCLESPHIVASSLPD